MKNRVSCILHSVISLGVGGLIYLLFREETYLHSILHMGDGILAGGHFPGDFLVRFYLPDFLWAYSLTMALYAVLLPRKNSILVVITVGGVGIAWELLQLGGCVSGTFDVFDCLTYLSAAILSNFIFLIRTNKT